MTNTRFAKASEWTCDGHELIYREAEHSFDVVPRTRVGGWSILVNDLNLELDSEGEVQFVWGLCARTTWLPTRRVPPGAERRRLRVSSGTPESPGISRRLSGEERWPIHVSMDEKWVVLGHDQEQDCTGVEFAPGMIAALDSEGQLRALWLRLHTV